MEKTDDKNKEIVQKENTEKKPENKASSEKMNSQLKWILLFIGVILIGAIAFFYFSQSKSKFEYGGINFERIKFDKLTLFYSKIEQKNSAGEVVLNYNLYLRNDPRKLESIPIEGDIRIKRASIISIDPKVEYCENGVLAGAVLSTFFQAAGVSYEIAYTNESYAKEKNRSYVVCNDSSPYTIITLKEGESNRISQESKNCYALEIRDCKILEVSERFIVAAIAHSKDLKV